jgi:thioredoxin reductase
MDDVVIVGGSFAGLSAALLLGRSRRQVTVLDTAEPRNRYAAHAHNLLGHDDVPPSEILAKARKQIQAYPTVRFVQARALSASGEAGNFTVETDAGPHQARRLILSYGVSDKTPEIPGFAECWGVSVLHCPYCHGYEVAGRHWGLIYSTPLSLHATALYGDWTDQVTLFSDGHDIPEPEKAKLDKRGVRLVEGKVAAIDHQDGQLSAVRLQSGEAVPLEALFAHPDNTPSANLHTDLGLEMVDTPVGTAVKVDDKQQTSLEGVYAAGDLATPMHSLFVAVRDGAMAGVQAQQSLITR